MKRFFCILSVLLMMTACAKATYRTTSMEGMPADAPVQTIKLLAKNCEWTPNKVTVDQGSHVILEVESGDDSYYNFILKHYKLMFNIPAKETVTAEFYAADAGEYEFGCYVETGRKYVWGGMVGKLIVAAK